LVRHLLKRSSKDAGVGAAEKNHILERIDVTKKIPGVTALHDVSFAVHRGKIQGVCGETGAGNYTLTKIRSGICPRKTYDGEVF
jgi:putative multiple sugar transport system ATP-binding protein